MYTSFSPRQIDELTLCALLKAGDRSAFEYLYDNYSAALFGEICRTVKDESAAEDILQEIFISVFQKFHTYDPGKGRLFTWLVTLSRNRAVDYLRSANRRHAHRFDELHDAIPAHHSIYDNRTEHQLLQRQLFRLPGHLRDLLTLIYSHGYTQEEAAIEQRLPLGTVKTRLRKGIALLKANCGVACLAIAS